MCEITCPNFVASTVPILYFETPYNAMKSYTFLVIESIVSLLSDDFLMFLKKTLHNK